ncbi:unnamed protein product [Sphenostylis stenocarpa]|uniref:Uncharacterized protein n=1 Tax=Sphenostylis stenocarpa TaxID=92480 RepID=A0AA87BBL1_9FABA|nr:unnamed protein product [Sphenostylis stenocarpa]
MMKEDINSCTKRVCEPFKAFGRRCTRLAKEQRARFYIFRRCITMLDRVLGIGSFGAFFNKWVLTDE